MTFDATEAALPEAAELVAGVTVTHGVGLGFTGCTGPVVVGELHAARVNKSTPTAIIVTSNFFTAIGLRI